MSKVRKKNWIIKAISIVMFILSIASLFFALMLVSVSITNSPLPQFPYVMIEYAWKFYLLIPIPLASLIFGIIFVIMNYNLIINDFNFMYLIKNLVKSNRQYVDYIIISN